MLQVFIQLKANRRNVRAFIAYVLSLGGCMHLSPMPPREAPHPSSTPVTNPIPETRTTGPKRIATSGADWDYFRSVPLMVPVEGISPEKVKDSFYDSRDNGRTHYAIDILAPRGTPVLAATRGKIVRMKDNGLGGITVYASDEPGKFVYYYAHLDRYADGVMEGTQVEQGDVLGYVGTTGNAPKDTPHLHFQVLRAAMGKSDWWNGEPIDARQFLTFAGKRRGVGDTLGSK
jgi:peptidoglycan LD-endopeptidase LytH